MWRPLLNVEQLVFAGAQVSDVSACGFRVLTGDIDIATTTEPDETVRRDLADFFGTVAEGVRGKRAVDALRPRPFARPRPFFSRTAPGKRFDKITIVLEIIGGPGGAGGITIRPSCTGGR